MELNKYQELVEEALELLESDEVPLVILEESEKTSFRDFLI